MNVISRFFDRLPNYWQQYLVDNDLFSGKDFKEEVTINFPDGSFAYFKYASVVKNSERKELAVFTEHCGYYIFNICTDFSWQSLKPKGT